MLEWTIYRPMTMPTRAVINRLTVILFWTLPARRRGDYLVTVRVSDKVSQR
jgi:hypothetical protein